MELHAEHIAQAEAALAAQERELAARLSAAAARHAGQLRLGSAG
jgi:hypothetical protein